LTQSSGIPLDGLQFPSLGLTFSGATPTDDFPSTVYSAAYDGFADFPRYRGSSSSVPLD
jgi:hypothetical protein